MLAAEMVKQLLQLHGNVRPQPATDWTGTFPIPPAVEHFYREIGPVDITIESYGNPYFLPSLADLWKFQAGHRWNGVSGKLIENWPDDWLVVADEGGDPFILARSSGAILHAFHGEGEWDGNEIFPDLNAMAACLAQIGATVSKVMANGMDDDDDDDANLDKIHELALPHLQKFLGSKSRAKTILELLGFE